MATNTVSLFKKAIPQASVSVLLIVDGVIKKFGKQFGLTTQKRIAAFMAQCAHESQNFTRLREQPNRFMKSYEGKKNLGNIYPGDGMKFIGRGLIQITGRYNYEVASKRMFKDTRLLDNPALLENPYYATLSALYFWDTKKLNRFADNDFAQLTKTINADSKGAEERFNNNARITNLINKAPDFTAQMTSGSTITPQTTPAAAARLLPVGPGYLQPIKQKPSSFFWTV